MIPYRERGAVVAECPFCKKASNLRRNTKEHSSFRRLTKYEYDYALQDLLGVPFALAGRLPPEATTEEVFKNSSELLQMSAMQFETYREIALKALKRATVSGERPKAVTYIISMKEEMNKAASAKEAKVFDKSEGNSNKRRNGQHFFNRETGKGIQLSSFKVMPRAEAVAGQMPAVSQVVMVLPKSQELKLDLDRFLPDEGIMRVRIRAGRSTKNPDEYAGRGIKTNDFLSAVDASMVVSVDFVTLPENLHSDWFIA